MPLTVRLVIEGPEASLGNVAASDVAKAFLHLESAIAKAMGHAVGRPLSRQGRWRKAIETAVRFHLVAVTDGSFQATLELPEIEVPVDAFDLPDGSSLGDMAFEIALGAAVDVAGSRADISKSWLDLVESIGIGSRYPAVRIETAPNQVRRVVRIDGPARERLREGVERSAASAVRRDRLTGRLYEADFERRSAELRTPHGVVRVSFDAEFDDTIHELLRRRADLVGEVTYDPRTSVAVAIKVREATASEQLALTDFWVDDGLPAVAEARADYRTTGTKSAITEGDWERLFEELGIEA